MSGGGARRLAFALLALLMPCGAARAQTFDEFQIFDGRITDPDGFDLNQHVVLGRQGRKDGSGAPRNGLLLTTEIGLATTTWHEVALYVPVAREFTGDIYGGGFKLRNSFVTPGSGDRPLAAGLDVELRHQPGRFFGAEWGVTLRPILDLRTGPWQLILNPAVQFPLGRSGPAFVPAVRGVRQIAPNTWLGLEHFMDLGPVSRLETTGRQAHQLFATVDFRLGKSSGIQFGVGHGLTHASDRWAGKMILSFDF